jgi:hypothetical protein
VGKENITPTLSSNIQNCSKKTQKYEKEEDWDLEEVEKIVL